MPRPVETLMAEHRVIETVLGSLETFVSSLTAETGEARQTLASYAEFFREFADRCHHGKEEDLLFPALVRGGMPDDHGPIVVMRQEHNVGRARVRDLASVGDGAGPLSDEELQRARVAGSEFIAMLRAHIQKEDNVLFRMADQVLPAGVQEELEKKFIAFDTEETGDEFHARMKTLSERLAGTYPPAS